MPSRFVASYPSILAESGKTADLDGDGDLDVWLTYPHLNRILVNGGVPRIESIAVTEGKLLIEFVGTLVSSDNVNSDFHEVKRATSPFSTPISGEIQIFGIR